MITVISYDYDYYDFIPKLMMITVTSVWMHSYSLNDRFISC